MDGGMGLILQRGFYDRTPLFVRCNRQGPTAKTIALSAPALPQVIPSVRLPLLCSSGHHLLSSAQSLLLRWEQSP